MDYYRAKKYPQDSETSFVPRPGILLLEDDVDFPPVGTADSRTSDIKIDAIDKTVDMMVSVLPLDERMKVKTSWGQLRDNMERQEKQGPRLPKMEISSFPKLSKKALPPLLECLQEPANEGAIKGRLAEDDAEEGGIEELSAGVDVAVYTSTKSGRPWVGRIVEMLEDDQFRIHWYRRKGRGKQFVAMVMEDGAPVTDVLDQDTGQS